MENLRYFKIGLFVIGATIIAIFGVVALGVGTVFKTKNLVETYIEESVQGLDVGSPVKFRGVLVGKVDEVGACGLEQFIVLGKARQSRHVPRVRLCT